MKKRLQYLISFAVVLSLVVATIGVSAAEQNNDESSVVGNESEVRLESELFDYILLLTQHLNRVIETEDQESAKVLLDWAEQQIKVAQKLYDEGQVDEAKELLQQSIEVIDVEVVEDDEFVENNEEDKKKSISDLRPTSFIGQNVLQLALNYEKIDNPVAKEAFLKNIKKSILRLEEKYGDISTLRDRLFEITDAFNDEEINDEQNEESNEEQSEESSNEETELKIEESRVLKDRLENYNVSSSIEKDYTNKNFSDKEITKNNDNKKNHGKKNKGKGNNNGKGKGNGNGKGNNK